MMLYDIPGLVLNIFSTRTQKKEKPLLCSKMICILNKKSVKTPPADDDTDEYRPSLHSVFLALLELLLAGLCLFLALNVIFDTQDEKCGPAENPISVFVNATDPSVLGGMLTSQGDGEINATSLAKMSKVSITINNSDTKTSSMRLGSTFVQMYIMASSCVLLGLSLVVMEGGRLLAAFTKKPSKFSPTFVDGRVFREICLDLGDVEKKDKIEPKY